MMMDVRVDGKCQCVVEVASSVNQPYPTADWVSCSDVSVVWGGK